MISSDFKGQRPLLIGLALFVTVWLGWVAIEIFASRLPGVCRFTGGQMTVVRGQSICSHVEGQP